jgi:G3E family GTPase
MNDAKDVQMKEHPKIEEAELVHKKVPVTILTGHLGAGKTTLLNKMLRNEFGLRIAVIENEFGNEIGIERLLANTTLKDGGDTVSNIKLGEVMKASDLFIELSNGCVCCSVKDTLVNTLETLLEKNRNRFDHIVIETTGLADPGPLAGIFWLDDELESDLVLDGVVTVVDLANIQKRLDDANANEAKLQLAYADRILLNKRDLISEENFEHILTRIRMLNPLATVAATSFANIDLEFCLNIQAFDSSRLRLRDEMVQVEHDPKIKSVVLRNHIRPINTRKLRDWIGLLLWEPKDGAEIFRVKGIIWDKDADSKVSVIQGVHQIFDIDILPDYITWGNIDEPKPITKIVIIGRNLNTKKLKAEFDSL